jgi:hypothetical protein
MSGDMPSLHAFMFPASERPFVSMRKPGGAGFFMALPVPPPVATVATVKFSFFFFIKKLSIGLESYKQDKN